ncbi:YggS family pyridoxal phosphate-dependent enzyme, partial [Bacteroidota bacterium]
FAEKVDFLSEYKSIRWHFIGHLQRNKTRLIVGRSDLFHGLDSVRLARSIESAAGGTGKPVDCLVQINVSAEDTKFGITPTELPALADVLSRIEDIRIRGLMTLAAPDLKEDALRQQFQRLRKLRDSMVSRGFVEASMLSMGMSSDFEIAIEEGATHVRIGSAIFGSRSLVRPD